MCVCVRVCARVAMCVCVIVCVWLIIGLHVWVCVHVLCVCVRGVEDRHVCVRVRASTRARSRKGGFVCVCGAEWRRRRVGGWW